MNFICFESAFFWEPESLAKCSSISMSVKSVSCKMKLANWPSERSLLSPCLMFYMFVIIWISGVRGSRVFAFSNSYFTMYCMGERSNLTNSSLREFASAFDWLSIFGCCSICLLWDGKGNIPLGTRLLKSDSSKNNFGWFLLWCGT